MSETFIRKDQLEFWKETIFVMSSDLCCESQVEDIIARDQSTAPGCLYFPKNANCELEESREILTQQVFTLSAMHEQVL